MLDRVWEYWYNKKVLNIDMLHLSPVLKLTKGFF